MNQLAPVQNEYKQSEISCLIIKPILKTFNKYVTRAALSEIVSQLNLDLEYLEKEDNWISYEHYIIMLGKMAEAADNPHAAYECGMNLMAKDSFGFLYYLLSVFKVFKVPLPAYHKIIEYRSLFSHTDALNIMSSHHNKIQIEYTLLPGFKPSSLNCDMVKGQLAAVPKFCNLPAAKVRELQCQVRGAPSCVYEIQWKSGRIKKIISGAVFLSIIGVELLYFFLHSAPLLSLKDIIISGLVCLAGFFGFLLFEHKRHIISHRNVFEKRSRELENAIFESKREYKELQRANQQIIEKANKLSIINRISAELIKTSEEDVLLRDVMKLIVDNQDFDVGFCLFIDNNHSMVKKPVVYTRAAAAKNIDLTAADLFVKGGVDQILAEKAPRVVQSDHLFIAIKRKEMLVIPFIIQNAFYYVMLFYNYDSEKKIDKRNLDFFNTISYQLEISLDNIYATKAAKAIISSLPSSLIVFNGYSLRISYINPSCLKTIGYKQKNILGNNIMSFLRIKDPLIKKNFCAHIKEVVNSQVVDDQELRIGHEIIGFSLFKMPALFGSSDEVGMIMKNITEQKEMKDQLFRAEKLAALGTLVSGIAHEINNPLYGVLGSAEIILDEAKQEFIKNYAKDIIDFIVQASDIVKDLSSYSREMREDKPSLVNVNAIMDDALRIVRYSKNFINININKRYEDTAPLFARAGELRQVYINLLNNAVQAMQGKGTITLVSKNGRHTIETQVSDTGMGIAEEILPKIFDPFFTTKQTGKGTGLGLNIVYRLVTQNNGVISVRSKPGKGTTFTIKYFLSKDKHEATQ
jgi:signal transduction histidine kinase